MQNSGIEGEKISHSQLKTISDARNRTDALNMSDKNLAMKAATGVAAITLAVGGMLYGLNRIDQQYNQGDMQVSITEPIGNNLPQLIDVQNVVEKPSEYWKPFEYYSGTLTVSLDESVDFRVGASSAPGNVIAKNKYITSVGGIDFTGASAIELKNPRFVMNPNGEVFAEIPDSQVFDPNPNADGTYTSKNRTTYVMPSMDQDKFVFKGGTMLKIENKQRETGVAGNGEKFNVVRAVFTSKVSQ